MMQFLQEISGDGRKCKVDLGNAWHHFQDGFHNLTGHRSLFNRFSNDTRNVSRGVNEFGLALQAVASSVGDCHLVALKSILDQLGLKLLSSVELKWADAFLKILIDGVPIEQAL